MGYSMLFLVEIWVFMSVMKSATKSGLTSVLVKDVAAMSGGLSQDRNALVPVSHDSVNHSMPPVSVHLNKSDASWPSSCAPIILVRGRSEMFDAPASATGWGVSTGVASHPSCWLATMVRDLYAKGE
jgi:hypothetical protein